MIHFEKVEKLPTQSWVLLRPKRAIKVDDTIVLESDDSQQQEIIVTNTTDRPGLMKGYLVVDFVAKNVPAEKEAEK